VRPVRRSSGPIRGSAARPAGGETDSMTEVISTGDPVLPCALGRVAMFPGTAVPQPAVLALASSHPARTGTDTRNLPSCADIPVEYRIVRAIRR
jgi:hypothetical protein